MKNVNQKEKRLQFYVDQREYETLREEYQASGFGSLSSYLRKKIIGNGVIIPYPKTLLNMLDKHGSALNRVGNNINQIAKKVHLYNKEGRFPADSLEQFSSNMGEYLKALKELSAAYRTLIRKLVNS